MRRDEMVQYFESLQPVEKLVILDTFLVSNFEELYQEIRYQNYKQVLFVKFTEYLIFLRVK